MIDESATAKPPSAVALRDVSIAFRLSGGGVYTAVAGASLQVADGEFVSIVGPTGCGKSTLLNVAAGLLAPASGRLDVYGSSLSALNRQAGYLFQVDALFPWKTALENVAIGLETAGIPSAEARPRAQGWLMRVGLGAFGDRYPHMLSGGQRKRVGLAQVLIRDPKIVLLDEPFEGLAPVIVRDLMNACRELAAAGQTIVLVEQNLAATLALADRVYIINNGHIVHEGPAKELKAQPDILQRYLGV